MRFPVKKKRNTIFVAAALTFAAAFVGLVTQTSTGAANAMTLTAPTSPQQIATPTPTPSP
jgi:hypothetical protein